MEASDSEIEHIIRSDDENYLSWLYSQEYLVSWNSHRLPLFSLPPY